MDHAPRFAIVAARAFERPVTLRLPFRFGNATVQSAPQAFVEVRIRMDDGRTVTGAGAELMIPKWFDKNLARSNERNVDDLRAATLAACRAYAEAAAPATAFGHAARHHAPLQVAGAQAGRTVLASAFGGALVDRAVMDALCRAVDRPFASVLGGNLPGIDTSLAPDLAGFGIDAFLRTLSLPMTIAVRHTVGMLDALTAADAPASPQDGLPVTLEGVIACYGHRHFKLKLAGDPATDIARLSGIARVLEPLPDYAITLDGNEQFADAGAVAEMASRLRREPGLRRLASATLYLEQPLPRDIALRTPAPTAGSMPMLIDESDDTYDAWPAARTAGYSGVSSKSCKGLYKSVVNAMRCAQWNARGGTARYFLSGEDLTTQAGLALQQDTALAATLGIAHVERNGHHYVNGFAGQGAAAPERCAFAAAHPHLYETRGDNVHVAIRDGKLALDSLACAGFASAARPDCAAMTPMCVPDPRPSSHEGKAA